MNQIRKILSKTDVQVLRRLGVGIDALSVRASIGGTLLGQVNRYFGKATLRGLTRKRIRLFQLGPDDDVIIDEADANILLDMNGEAILDMDGNPIRGM